MAKKIAEIIKSARKTKGYTLIELAKSVNSSAGHLSDIENGKKIPGGELLISLSRELEIDLIKTSIGARPVKRIPVLGTVPAGFPMPTVPIVAEAISEWVYRSDLPEDAYALKVEGDSMPPLETGDYVAFVPNGDYRDKDRVVVANEFGDPIVKRLRIRSDGSMVLVSDNPKYEPIVPNEYYRIIGKVIKAWRELI